MLLAARVTPQFLWQISTDTVLKFNYEFGDDFNQGPIETSKWQIGFPWGRSLILQDNVVFDKNFIFENGKLEMVVEKIDSLIGIPQYLKDTSFLEKHEIKVEEGGKHRFVYSTALIWSKRTFQYGYFEIKFKGVRGQGIWPAFWLYGGNPNYEIDFFELKGERENSLHVNVHCPSGCSDYRKFLNYRKGWGHWIKTNESLFSSENIVSGHWDPEGITWFLNGKIIARSNQQINIPMNLVIGTGVAKNDGPFKPGANQATPFPNKFIVDYVRVYALNNSDVKLYQNADSFCEAADTGAVMSASVNRRKLKNAPKKYVKKDFNTVSVLPGTRCFYVRVLGSDSKDPTRVTFMNLSNQIIKEFYFSRSGEVLFTNTTSQDVYIQVSTKGKIITDRLRANQ